MWPGTDAESEADNWSRRVARSLLPLPIDQRYGEPEMTLVLKAVERAGRVSAAPALDSR